MESPTTPLTEHNLAILGGEDAQSRDHYQDTEAADIGSNAPDVSYDDLPLVAVKRPGPVKHESAASASYHLMSGKTSPIYGGLLFIPSHANEKPFRLRGEPLTLYLAESGHRFVETQEELEEARQFLKYAKSANPRFLFRGFHCRSGGDEFGLNNRFGVTPHAYLDGMEHANMWQIPAVKLYEMITGHIQHNPSIRSAFSSWTHTLSTALLFALDGPTSMIAVVDTTHESMVDRVWSTEDLLGGAMTDAAFPDEFLIDGPVLRPNSSYHCVSVRELMKTTRVRDIIDGSPDAFGTDRISSIERGAVEASRQIATALQPAGADVENIVILTARFVGVRAAKFIGLDECLSHPGIHAFLYHIRDDLQHLVMRHGARDISLSDQTMDTSFSHALEAELQMLQAAEDAIHVMAWDMRAGIWRLLTATHHSQGGDAQVNPSAGGPAKRSRTDSDDESTPPHKRTKIIDLCSDEDDD